MRITPISTTTPTGATTTALFNTVTAFGAKVLRDLPLKRLGFNINNDQAGTLQFQFSEDGGTTWTTFRSQAVAAPAANLINQFEQNIDTFIDVKVDFINGGVDQTVWSITIEGFEAGDERMPAVP